jgi:Spy/CpxP family protein refolding chaperone
MKTRTPILAALILVVAAAAWAQPGPGPRGRGDDEFPARLLERLDLTEAQTAAIAKTRDEARERGRETRKEMMRLRHELQGIMMQDQPDAAAAEKLIARMGELRTEQQVRRMQTRLAVRNQLTPEQRDRLPSPGEGPRGRGFRAERSGPDDGCGMRADVCRHPSGGRGPGACDSHGPHGPRGGNR